MKRIVLVEDNPADVVLMRAAFAAHAADFAIDAVDSQRAARAALERGGLDLLIADLALPDGNGTELIAFAHAHGCATIMLTGRGDEMAAVRAMHAGALDYVVKSAEQIAEMPRVATRALREWAAKREHAERARLLAESRERFQTFAELAADWFWETDAQLRMTFFSDRFCLFDKKEPEKLLGTTLREAMADFAPQFDWTAAETLWQRRYEFEVDLTNDANEGARTVHMRGVPFFDDESSFQGYRGIARDVTRERDTLQQITHLAMHDPLTDLLNRRSFDATLKTALYGVVRQSEHHVFCFFDIDGFKSINDTYGHFAGDAVLREVAQTIAQEIRVGDSLGRLGGDEFGLLLKHCTLKPALEVARKAVGAIAARTFAIPGSAPARIGISCGVVALPGDGNATQVLTAADQACYRAKRAGGGQVLAAHLSES